MPFTSSVSALYEFGAAAIFGAATKTYFDYRSDLAKGEDCRSRLLKVLVSLLINSIFAALVAPHIAVLFITSLPSWSSFGVAIAYLAGALSLNIMFGLLSVKWEDVIKKRFMR